jgi:DNA-binding CsgD family transcriptional regulator
VAAHPPDGLIGREREIAMGRARLAAVRGGAAGVVVVEGEAGIGKTALVDGYAAVASGMGIAVVRGAAHPFERNRPFGAVIDALELRPRSADERRAAVGRLLVDEGRGDASETVGDARFQIVEEVTDLLETMCAETPVLLLLEDLHWADDSTLATAAAIVHRLAHVPLLVVLTCRPAPRSAALDMLWETCGAVGADFCRLPPLGGAEVDALVQQQLGGRAGALLASIVRRAAGNPLLVVELLRSLVAEGWLSRDGDSVEATGDELPSTMRDLVLRRMHYLPAHTLEILQLCSVLGDSVSIRDLAVVSRHDEPSIVAVLAEAFRGKLLDERGRSVAFRHQLVQQAIYEDIPVTVRETLHRHVAGMLARTGADLSKVASHLLVGAEPGDLEAVRLLREAAAQAAPSAPSVSVDLLRRAADLLPAGSAETDATGSELAAALLRAGQVAEAAALAEGILDRPHRPDVDRALHLTLVDALGPQQRAPQLLARANAALETASLGPADQALVLTQASYGQIFVGDFPGGEITAARALTVAESAADAEMTCWSLCALTVATKTQGRYGEALSMARRAAALAADPASPEARRRLPDFFLGMALADNDELDDARLAYARSIVDAQRLGTGSLLPEMLLQAAELRFITGEWDDALVEFEAGLDLAKEQGQKITVPQSCSYLALIALARGDVLEAKRSLSRLDDRVPRHHLIYGSEIVALAASAIAEAEGAPGRALDLLLHVWRYDIDHEVRYWDRYLGPALARLAVGVGRSDVAEQVVTRLDENVQLSPDVPSLNAAALRCRGLLGRDPESLQRAVDLARDSGRVLDFAGSCEDAASSLVTAGDTDQATVLLQEALVVYGRLEATDSFARVGAALRALGVRRGTRGPRQRPQRGWDSLTASERKVSELVADGLTNRDVARHLHVSPHTVNTHLRHVFQKLDVATRAELAARVVRLSIPQITRSSDVSDGPDDAH